MYVPAIRIFYTHPILWYYIDAIIRLTFMLFSLFHHITWVISNIMGKLFLNLKAYGRENLKNLDSGGVLFVANHQGMFDPFLIGASIPFSYLLKIKCFRYQTYYKQITRRFYGFFIWLMGAYPVYPGSGPLEKVLEKTVKILKDNQSILIFPEGKLNQYFDPVNAKLGVGYLAKNLNPLIVPVFIKNNYNVKITDLIFRSRKVSVTFGKPFHWQDIALPDAEYGEIAKKIMGRVGGLVKFPPVVSDLTFVNVQDRERTLKTPEAEELLSFFPDNIKKLFIENYLNSTEQMPQEVLNYFLDNSKIAKLIKAYPGSAEAFEYLYREEKALFPIDKYFLKCKAGQQVHQRLISLDQNIPQWIKKIYKDKTVLVDNVGSGPGRDMIRILLQNSGLTNKVHVRNIDIDKKALEIGEKIVEQNKLFSNFSFIAKSFHKVKPRKADVILLIGFLCPIRLHTSERILSALIRYSKPGGLIIFSTVQKRMLYEDPLTDYIMRFTGWNMSYKFDEEAMDLARESGWRPIAQFFDEPLHYHCMTVAELK